MSTTIRQLHPLLCAEIAFAEVIAYLLWAVGMARWEASKLDTEFHGVHTEFHGVDSCWRFAPESRTHAEAPRPKHHLPAPWNSVCTR
jgi:hypothetical protein